MASMISLSSQTLLFFTACLIGGGLGFSYDLFRSTRIAFKTHKIVVFIEDILFFKIVTIVSFIFLMMKNDGSIRGFLLIGEVLGGIIYFFTLSGVVIALLNWIMRVVKCTLSPIGYLFVEIYKFFSRCTIKLLAKKIITENK